LYEKKEEEDDEIRLSAVCFSASAYSKVRSWVLLRTARQYHSLCMHLWFGVCSFFGHYLGDT